MRAGIEGEGRGLKKLKGIGAMKKILRALLVLAISTLASAAFADGLSAFSVKDGGVYKGDVKIECELNTIAPGVADGAVRYWAAIIQGEEPGPVDFFEESGVWFFDAKGAAIAFDPYSFDGRVCKGVVFSPGGKYFLLVKSLVYTGRFDTVGLYLYETESMKPLSEEIASFQDSFAWVDGGRFVMTRLDGTHDPEESDYETYGILASAVMFDAAAGKETVLKRATATKNYRIARIDDGGSLTLAEDSVKSVQDWEDEEKIQTKEIRVKVPEK
jgi:hypothetical protein